MKTQGILNIPPFPLLPVQDTKSRYSGALPRPPSPYRTEPHPDRLGALVTVGTGVGVDVGGTTIRIVTKRSGTLTGLEPVPPV